jgi:hypothetical protein
VTVGNQASSGSVNNAITSLSVQMRGVMQAVSDLSTFVNGQGTGLATLESLGYDSTDAQTALNMISYLNTVAGVYFGTASQATEFNFNQELSQMWAGQ